MAPEGNPFQQARPLTSERHQLFTRTAESLAERYEEELARWVSESTVRADPVEQLLLPTLAVDDTDLAIVRARYHVTHGLVVTDLHLALSMVAMLCGGAGEAPAEIRPLSRLETGVFNLVIDPLIDLAAELFEIGPVEIGSHVSTASNLPDSSAELGVAVPLQLTVGNVEGKITVGLTLGQLQQYNEDLDRRLAGRSNTRRNGPSMQTLNAVQPIEVDLIVGFDPMRIPAGKLAGLQVGDVLRTRQSVSKNLVARVGSERIFTVRAAQRGQRLVAELVAPIELDRGLE